MDMHRKIRAKPFAGLGMKVTKYSDKKLAEIAAISASEKFTSIESFSGPGGMSLGLAWAGFRVAAAFDYDEPTVRTYQKNLDHCFQADARNVSGAQLLAFMPDGKNELDLFSGGPPCQGFSKQRRGGHEGDDRNELVLEFTRLVDELKPKFFLFENVAIFGQLRGKKYLSEMRRRLKDYSFTPSFYNAADYGLPQTRERFILVGQRLDLVRSTFQIPKPTVKIWRTVGEVLRGLPEPLESGEHSDFLNHIRTKITPLNEERFSHVPQGGGWKDIPVHLRLPCHSDEKKAGGWPDVYGRLRLDGQCPTITGGFDSFTRGRYGHLIQNRAITPREAARIQGFPDAFEFTGTRSDVRSQIGNVVPPPLAEAVGLEIARCLLIEKQLIEAA